MTTLKAVASSLSAPIVALGLVLGMPSIAAAQANGPDAVFDAAGVQPNRDYFSKLDFERIDTLNGNVMLSFTDVSLPGPPGLEVNFVRHFNSKRGWTFGLAGIPMQVVGITGPAPERPTQQNPPNTQVDPVSDWLPKFYMADGSVEWTTWERDYLANPYTGGEKWRWAVSASFARYDRFTGRLYLPDGRVAEYETGVHSVARLRRITTPFSQDGNYEIRIDYSPIAGSSQTNDTITQQLGPGQTRTLYAPGGLTYGPSRLELRTNGVLQSTWTYTGAPGSFTVTPPTGPAWVFNYGVVDGYGVLSSVQTPGGATISYGWERKLFQRDIGGEYRENILKSLTSTVVTSRTVSGNAAGGTWTYQYQDTGGIDTTTVTHPGGTVRESTTHSYLLAGNIRALSLIQEPVYDGTISSGYDTSAVSGYVLRERRVEELNAAGTAWLLRERETRDYQNLEVTRYPNGSTVPEQSNAVLKKITLERDGATYVTEHFFAEWKPFADYHQPWQTEERSASMSRSIVREFQHDDAPYILGRVSAQHVSVLTSGNPAPSNYSTSATFDGGNGFRTSVTEAGITTAFEWAAGGFVATKIDGHGHRTEYSYDWGVPWRKRTPLQEITRVINPTGTVASQTVRGNKTTTYGYDSLFRVISIAPPASHATGTAYAPDGRSATMTRGNFWLRTDVDGFGRVVGTEGRDGVRTTREYDSEGRLEYESLPFDGTHPRVRTRRLYDGLGRLVREIKPNGTASVLSYDSVNGGPRVTITDAKGRVTRYEYRAFGHPSDTRLATLVDADGTRWSYTYNAAGNLTSVSTPDGKTRSWVYDGRNLLVEESHPESGLTRYEHNDDIGLLTKKTDARGKIYGYVYDEDERVREIISGAHVTRIDFEANSNLRSAIDVNGLRSEFGYDAAGRVLSRTDRVRERTFSSSYTYDLHGNLEWLRYRNDPEMPRLDILHTYDPNTNRLTRVEDDARDRIYGQNFAFHPSGAIESMRHRNGVVETFELDSMQRPFRARAMSGATGVMDLSYAQYDVVDNLELLNDNLTPSKNQQFVYDNLDRLTFARGAYGDANFAYDIHGNRITVPGMVYEYEGNTNRMTRQGGDTFGYDAAGNLTSFNVYTTFEYDPHNRVTALNGPGGRSSYQYDGDDMRKVRSVSATR